MSYKSTATPEQQAPAADRSRYGLGGWVKCSDQLPPQDVIVETKIDDGKGVRNVGTLRRYKALWFTPDNAMYVYYTPTHWRHKAS